MDVMDLPKINAALNSMAATCLVLGYISIKKGKEDTHKMWMLSATAISALFLTSYLIYHYHVGSVKFQGEGWTRWVYFSILIPHVILAAVNVPMILMTLFHALRDNREKHLNWARWTFPIWMFVSVSGVAVYLMLYHFFA